MLFCPKCGSILRPKDKAGKRILWCSCGFTADLEKIKKEKEKKEKEELKEEKTEETKEKKTEEKKPEEKKEETKRKIEIVEEIETHPKIKAKCPKCENNEAYYWTQQTRGADEPETRFFKCTKCNYTWREYA